MRSSSGRINIAASTQKLDVDDRISFRFYCRIADNILKQADIFRKEGNIIDLYIMLLRFSSLVSETIPCHREYQASPQRNRIYLKKKLLNALNELEKLKPEVQKKVDELNRKHIYQANGWGHLPERRTIDSSLEWPPIRNQSMTNYSTTKMPNAAARGSRSQQYLLAKPVEEQFQRLDQVYATKQAKRNEINKRTLAHIVIGCCSCLHPLYMINSILCSTLLNHLELFKYNLTSETCYRHRLSSSRLFSQTFNKSHTHLPGPNGLHGQWQPPSSGKRVQYPSNIDFSPVEVLRENGPDQTPENRVLITNAPSNVEHEGHSSGPALPLDNEGHHPEKPSSLISFEAMEAPLQTEIVRQPSPPPVLADVQDLIPESSPVIEAGCIVEEPFPNGLISSESPLQLHISTALMDSFMKLAKSNTDKNLETCGVLAGSLKNRKFYVTALIIPKQESTSDSCQTTNEEEIFEVQDKQSLFPLGWIHTHPTQSCFMSSIDLHTHYSYQIMLPEAIAIVMAPKDCSRSHGIFRLTTPGGMTVIRQCPRRGFHPHDQPPDGGPIYKQCTDVYMNPDVKFDVMDLR